MSERAYGRLLDKCEKLEADNARLIAALQECAAEYISPPCSVAQGAQYTTAEFQRRMRVAAAALEPKP